MPTIYANLWKECNNGLEVCWAIPFVVTPYRAATYLDPPEGGIDIDGDPHVCELKIVGASGTEYRMAVTEDSETDHDARRIAPIGHDEMWDAVNEECERIVDANEAAYEDACENGYRGPIKSAF